MCRSAIARDGEAYIDIRVCDLQLQQGTMPSGLDSVFQIDGLYVVLRCGDEVRRTHCLWPSTYTSSKPPLRAVEGEGEHDWVWNELFRFPLPPPPQPQQGNAATFQQTGQRMAATAAAVRRGPGVAVSPPLSSSSAAGGTATSAGVSTSPFLYPSVDLELWRSTTSSELCLGCYTYHLPLELLHGGYGLTPPDRVADRVVPLRSKEAPPSIMGNLYGWSAHRLSLRLRVQAVGLAPISAEWALPADVVGSAAPVTANTVSGGGYALPYSLAMADSSHRSSIYHAGYGTSMGSLNPVLANLLAPLGISSGQGSMLRPGPGGGGTGERGGVLPPVFPQSMGGGAVLSSPAGASAVDGGVACGGGGGGAGVLGDGDLVWRGAVLPAVFPGYPAPSQ